MNESIQAEMIAGGITQAAFFAVVGIVIVGCSCSIVYLERRSLCPSDTGYIISVLIAIVPFFVGCMWALTAIQCFMIIYGG